MPDRERYHWLKSKCRCISCKKQDAYTLAGRTYCYECNELKKKALRTPEAVQKQKERYTKIHKERVDKHLCTKCGAYSRIDKKNISSWRLATITGIPVYDKPCGSIVKTVAVASKLTVTSKIVSGKYAGWTCILLDGKDRFVRTACLKLGEKRLK